MFQMARPHHLSHLLFSTRYSPHHRFRLQIKASRPGAHGWIGRNELTEHESGSLPPDRFSNAWMPSSRVRILFPDGYDNVCFTAQAIMGMGLWLWVVERRTMMALLAQPCGESPGILLGAGSSCRGASAAAAAAVAMRAVSVCVVRRRLFPSMGGVFSFPPQSDLRQIRGVGPGKRKEYGKRYRAWWERGGKKQDIPGRPFSTQTSLLLVNQRRRPAICSRCCIVQYAAYWTS